MVFTSWCGVSGKVQPACTAGTDLCLQLSCLEVAHRLLAVQVLWDSQVVEAFGNDKGLLGGLKVQNVHTKEIDSIEASPISLGFQSCRGLWQAASAIMRCSELCL